MNGKEKAEQARFDRRCQMLRRLGAENSGTCWIHQDRVITTAEIQYCSDQEWQEHIEAIKRFNQSKL